MADSERRYELVVSVGGERVDRYVADALEALSRTAVQRLIDAGSVTVNGKPVGASDRVQAGDAIVVSVPPPQTVSIAPQAIPLDILYEDADIVVVNKAAGMVVHPGAGQPQGTLVNAVLAHSPDLAGVGGELRPGIVHRLDRDTSGVIIVAKHDQALRHLQRQFKRRTVEKHYVALVVGQIPQAEGLIEAPIGRDRRHRKRMAVRGGGKMARTRWRVIGRYRDDGGRTYTLVDVHLLTGRTHQIRVHFSWMGYTIVGDETYGSAAVAALAPRQFLHAKSLEIAHPSTNERMTFVAPLSSDLAGLLDSLHETVD
ncbi:MAG: RluA family pseudouridine synthase [Anaerolineae bacterium]|nr:RluA family pseudouridine synthase [Anaerolineae bacterium]